MAVFRNTSLRTLIAASGFLVGFFLLLNTPSYLTQLCAVGPNGGTTCSPAGWQFAGVPMYTIIGGICVVFAGAYYRYGYPREQ